jgi:hypothetical protein
LGKSNIAALASEAERELERLRYHGETRSFNFEMYVNAHIQCHNTLSECMKYGHHGLSEQSKIDKFLDGIKTHLMDAPKTSILNDREREVTTTFDTVVRICTTYVRTNPALRYNPRPDVPVAGIENSSKKISHVSTDNTEEELNDRSSTHHSRKRKDYDDQQSDDRSDGTRNVNGATNEDENGEERASDDDHRSHQDDWNRNDTGRNAGTPDDHGENGNRNSRGRGNRGRNGNKKSDAATAEVSLQDQVAELRTAVSTLTDLFTQFTKKMKTRGTNDHKTLRNQGNGRWENDSDDDSRK